MRHPKLPPPSAPIVWTRADPTALAAWNPATKRCTMNCGPHRNDPRSPHERMFLCNDCEEVPYIATREGRGAA